MILSLLIAIYIFAALYLTAIVAGQTTLLILYWTHRHNHVPLAPVDEWPTVTVQLPIYNEQHVIERLLKAVAAFDYPRDKLMVQVLDDSTDETTAIITRIMRSLQDAGLAIQHIRRAVRAGYKAGALAYGMTLTDSEFTVVFDADFVPPPDFLKRTVPHLVADESLGMVQTRWGHLNAVGNLLTRSQTLAIDGHFVVEQLARNRAGLLMSLNGTGCVLRTACIHDAGGWLPDTLTEDLDLSYRAQLAGWRFLYLPDVVVPGEVPPQIAAYKQQQARWGQGSTQCLSKHLIPVWRADFTLAQRIMATLHLSQYMPAPMLLILLLLTPVLMITGGLEQFPSLAPLGVVGIGPPVMMAVAQDSLYPDWKRRMWVFPLVTILGTGIAWNNTYAVMTAFRGAGGEFKRTPKFSQHWQHSRYALRGDATLWVEIGLALYALWGVVMAARHAPLLIPYLSTYLIAFTGIIIWQLADRWQMGHHRVPRLHDATDAGSSRSNVKPVT